jgi:hypothetical protein
MELSCGTGEKPLKYLLIAQPCRKDTLFAMHGITGRAMCSLQPVSKQTEKRILDGSLVRPFGEEMTAMFRIPKTAPMKRCIIPLELPIDPAFLAAKEARA